MGVTNTFKLHVIQFGTVGSAELGGIEDDNVMLDSELRSEAYGGDVFPYRTSMAAQNPGVTFTTYQLARAFTLLSPAVVPFPYALAEEGRLFPISIAALTGGLSLFGHKYAEATYVGGTTAGHHKYNITKGCAWWNDLSCTHQDEARLSCSIAPTWDGTNNPIVKTSSAALPTNVAEECFTLGPVRVAGIRLRAFRELRISSGIRVDREGAESDIWPTMATVGAVLPELSLTGIDPDWVDDVTVTGIPTTGSDCTHAGPLATEVYLRKRLQGGSFVADAVPQHVRLTFNGMVVPDAVARRRVTQAGETSLMVKCNSIVVGAPATMDPPIKIYPNVLIDTSAW